MAVWRVTEAKARFSALLDSCAAEGPQMLARRGAVEAVLVPLQEFERLQAGKKASTYDLLLSNKYFRGEMDIPPRGQLKHRKPPAF